MTITALCFECGARAEHAHHVVPRSRGGTRTVPLCVSCHGKAHDVVMSTSVLTLAALAAKKSKGERTGQVPYGFNVSHDGIHLEENPAEQTILATVRELRAAGLSIRAIAERLNVDGAPARGARWHATTVANVLNRMAA